MHSSHEKRRPLCPTAGQPGPDAELRFKMVWAPAVERLGLPSEGGHPVRMLTTLDLFLYMNVWVLSAHLIGLQSAHKQSITISAERGCQHTNNGWLNGPNQLAWLTDLPKIRVVHARPCFGAFYTRSFLFPPTLSISIVPLL